MKTIFEGTVNGKKFNSVEGYNEELMRLINSGVEVSANSRTFSEPTPQPKKIFEGVVNGKKFDNVEEYNEEVKRVLSAGESLNASSQTRYSNECACENECKCECENECTCECDSCQEEAPTECPPEFFYGLEDNGCYLDTITGTDGDEGILNSWVEDLAKNNGEIVSYIRRNFSIEDLKDYFSDLNEALDQLNQDKQNIVNLTEKYDSELKYLEQLLKEKEQNLRVINNCDILNKLFIEHYNSLSDYVKNSIDKFDSNEDIQNQEPSCEEVPPTQEEILKTRNKFVSELLKNLFPRI